MEPITSREYKLMLAADRFAGDQAALTKAASALWRDLAGIIVPTAVAVSGTDDVKRKLRQVHFLDTADHQIRRQDYVVRERTDQEDGGREVTLKFRHPDRFISQDRDMKPADGFETDMKFEEDIKPRFQSLFSFSSSVVVDDDETITTFGDVTKLFPGLANELEDAKDDTALAVVGDFTAFERVIKGTSFQIRRDPEVSAECSLTLWYDDETAHHPIVAEFSFKYENADGEYTAVMARRAYDAFMAIQDHLGDWIDPESMTKTAYVYGLVNR
jgi:hypothetical protein